MSTTRIAALGGVAGLLALAGCAMESPATDGEVEQIDTSTQELAVTWCHHDDAVIHAGNFDGDWFDDLLCHTAADSGWISVDYSSDGLENANDWQNEFAFCKAPNYRLYIGDANGDGRDDLICHSQVTARVIVDFATSDGRFYGANWASDWDDLPGWCDPDDGRLLVGDVNDDGDDDLICHNLSTGVITVTRAINGKYTMRDDDTTSSGWCNWSGAVLHIGDANRDGRDDLICHSTSYGWIDVEYAATSGHPYAGRSEHWSSGGWCLHSGARFLVADADGNGRVDLVCQSDSGYVSVDFADSNGRYDFSNDSQFDFNFCTISNPRLVVAHLFPGLMYGTVLAGLICQDPVTRDNTLLPWLYPT